jgi:chromate transporter
VNSLWAMFLVFFKTSISTFGGGFAMIPMMTQELTLHGSQGWFTAAQLKDIIAISVMTPGAFGSSAAAFSGMMAYGPVGAAVCAAGVVLPSAILSTAIARWFYGFQKNRLVQGALSGIKPVVIGLIAATAFKMAMQNLFTLDYTKIIDLNALWAFLRSLDWRALLIFAVALLFLVKFKVDPVLVILGCGVLGLIFYILLPMLIG